ncbi:hypothetical protein JCM24511_04121 [Saitozyma sp. JCM 24511]|nr:hypothetical protein JCM24511_04121 [Saitozyma sp. JCM 24511]
MSPHTIRWGIISTGGIATKFSQDILVDPSTREVTDVAHRITAIGSRSVASAQAFIDKLKAGKAPYDWAVNKGLLDDTKAYGSYEEVYNDPNVDAIYIGTPHTFHHANAKGALLGGKHVLCEKPFTLDLEELDELIAIAKDKKLFLMEAVWTRFHPIAYAVQDIIHSGKLGKVKRFSSEFSMDFDPDNRPYSHRMIDPALGGGSLLDMGPYPSVWAMLVLHQHPLNKDRKPPKLHFSHQTLYPRSNVDLNSRWLLEWEGVSQAMLMTDMNTHGPRESTVYISCEEGDLALEWGPFKPQRFWLIPHPPGAEKSIKETTEHHYPVSAGGGMAYEADEVARCVRDGKLESERMPWEESRIVQSWFDQVRRAGGGVLADAKGNAGK